MQKKSLKIFFEPRIFYSLFWKNLSMLLLLLKNREKEKKRRFSSFKSISNFSLCVFILLEFDTGTNNKFFVVVVERMGERRINSWCVCVVVCRLHNHHHHHYSVMRINFWIFSFFFDWKFYWKKNEKIHKFLNIEESENKLKKKNGWMEILFVVII